MEDVGRVFGEPGDGFHDAYVEGNYAYRAALGHCQALVRTEPGCPDATGCNAAFYHVGGGRGTRPNKVKDIANADDAWIFYGTRKALRAPGSYRLCVTARAVSFGCVRAQALPATQVSRR